MKKTIFVIGGARSGKSSYAVDMARRLSKKVAFIATAVPSDREMEERIEKHRASRPHYWKVIEGGKDAHLHLDSLKGKCEIALIDCLGLYLSNLMAGNAKDNLIIRKVKRLIRSIHQAPFTVIVISNDVGGGIVPDNKLARRFRDLLGLANQLMAKEADQVVLMQAGIPLIIKGEKTYAVTE